MNELRLPWAPSTNALWRSVVIKGRSMVLLSREGRATSVTGISQLESAKHWRKLKMQAQKKVGDIVMSHLFGPLKLTARRRDTETFENVWHAVTTQGGDAARPEKLYLSIRYAETLSMAVTQ